MEFWVPIFIIECNKSARDGYAVCANDLAFWNFCEIEFFYASKF